MTGVHHIITIVPQLLFMDIWCENYNTYVGKNMT